MSRRQRTPAYRLHAPSGQAVVTLTDANGKRRDVYLGKYDDTPNSEIADAFKPHVDTHYRYKDGTPTPEVELFRLSLMPLRRLYGSAMARDFGPLALKAVRTAMITGDWMTDEERAGYHKAGKPVGLCRGTVNKRIGRIRRMFRWAVEEEMIPATILHALEAVKGLEAGRSAARETEPVQPVPETRVLAVLPFLRPQLADMVQLQIHTGMRSGEICIMRAIDIDTTGSVWLYKPAHHKTAHRGLNRIVPLGPKAQEIVKRNLKTDLYAYLFSLPPADGQAGICPRPG
jgi:integrase